MNKRRCEVLGALGWLAFALYVCAAAVRLGIGRPGDPGSGFIFLWSGLVLATLVVVLLFRPGTEPDDPRTAGRASNAVRMAAAVAVLFLYVLLFDSVGFLLTTPVMMGTIVRLGEERRWGRIVTFAAGATAGAYVILQVWLGLRLPAGIFN